MISGLIDRVGGLSDDVPEARFAPREADPPLEEVISGAERELEELCGRYDYRQLLYLSRLCTGVPALRDADADTAATRVRVQNSSLCRSPVWTATTYSASLRCPTSLAASTSALT